MRSFTFAAAGLKDMLMTEANAWVHAAATAIVLVVCFWLRVDRTAFALIIMAAVSVWVAETFNTVLELMVDMVTTEKYSAIARRAKDIAAAAVLITTMGAVLVGILVLGPPFYERLASVFS